MQSLLSSTSSQTYNARIEGREILTPSPAASPRITGAAVFGVRPGKPIRFRVSATGEGPIVFSATGLPAEVTIDSVTGWINGQAPQEAGDLVVNVEATNGKGSATRELIIQVARRFA